MEVVVPVVGFLCLATLIVASPRVGPRRVRRRASAIAAGLCDAYGFVAAPDVDHVLRGTTAPPFHYGSDHRFEDVVTGGVGGLPVTSAAYICRYNGSPHLYGVVGVTLPGPGTPERIEIRSEPVFESAWAIDTPPVDGADGPLRADDVAALMSVSEPPSLRVEDRLLLMWRRDGWSSPAELLQAVTAASEAVARMRLVR